jgi:hypothetical protein
MTIRPELLDELLKDCQTPQDLFGENGILKQLTKGMIEFRNGWGKNRWVRQIFAEAMRKWGRYFLLFSLLLRCSHLHTSRFADQQGLSLSFG